MRDKQKKWYVDKPENNQNLLREGKHLKVTAGNSDTPKKLLVARLCGGLGNQMFIYAAARRLALKNDAELALDIVNGFTNDSYERFFQLDLFNLKARIATPNETMRPFHRIRRKLAIFGNKNLPFNERDFVKQNGVEIEKALLEMCLGQYTYLEGYWQGEVYFRDCADIIRDDFQLVSKPSSPNLTMFNEITIRENPVALHVRFFDPPDTEKSDNATITYYQNAMTALEEKIANPYYYIFSDLPYQASKMLNLKNDCFTLVTHNDTPETSPFDMWLMSRCRHFVIANSTFSWWGAWLGQSEDKIVFAPKLTKDVFGKYASWGFEGLLPVEWQQIE